MKPLPSTNRRGRKSASSILLLGTFALASTLAFAGNPASETIHATYVHAGHTNGVTLIVYKYSNSSDLRALSTAFQGSHDQELATALSNTKAAGRCTIAGAPGYEVAFIQMVLTPTGRRITFITTRPLPLDEDDPLAPSESFDLAVGQFNLNDADSTKSTGFLFPASKLVIDEQGEYHYDLAGVPLTLVNILDSNRTPPSTESPVAVVTSLEIEKDRSPSNGH
jgi:hypothetical protein